MSLTGRSSKGTMMSTRRLLAGGAALALAASLMPAGGALAAPAAGAASTAFTPAVAARSAHSGHDGRGGDRGTYTNPVTDGFSDTYADPAIIRGHDGWWYLYATSDPLVSGGEFGIMHTARSRDLVDWEYLGTVFDETTVPEWAAEGSFFWAPDVRRIGDEYIMYFTVTVTDTDANPGADNAIGYATAPTAAGPWTASDGPVVEPSIGPGADPANPWWSGTIDPALLATEDGRLYLYYGGFAGGVFVVELDETGRESIGEPTRVAFSDRYEGSYVVERGGWYYLMLSSAGCCAGPTAGYSVFAGRARSPLGPFVDHEGVSLNQSRPGGTQVVAQNGNRWVGVGHHAVVTDLAGQDWIVYHGIDRDQPWLNEPGGINRRPTLIDRLDWIDGWPMVRAGRGPSESAQPAPVTAGALGIDLDSPAADSALRAELGRWRVAEDDVADAGEIGRLVPGRAGVAMAESRRTLRGDAQVEADVRLDGDTRLACVGLGRDRRAATVCINGTRDELVLRDRGRVVDRAAIPERVSTSGWLSLSITARDGRVAAELSESRLGDPEAQVNGKARTASRSALTLATQGGALEIDNLSVAPAADLVTRAVRDPRVGRALFSEGFNRDPARSGWELVQPTPGIQVAGGELRWPLTGDDLAGDGRTAPLLLRDAPEGDWSAETEFTFDVGTDTVRNYQQAGLIVYVNDDDFIRLGSVALGASRVVEYFVERPGDGRLDRGSFIGGPTAATMHLRILKTTAANGEQRYRSASSTDGAHWRWGAVWTLPADAEPRIGLYAGGGANPPAVAEFDSFTLRAVR